MTITAVDGTGPWVGKPGPGRGGSTAGARPVVAGVLNPAPGAQPLSPGPIPPAPGRGHGPATPAEPMLRPSKRLLRPGELMIRLNALAQAQGVAAAESHQAATDALIRTKDRQALEQMKKIQDLFEKLRDALRSWVAKLPGWLTGIASAAVTCLIGAVLAAGVVASGGLAAAPLALSLPAVCTCMAGLSSFVMANGQIISDLTGHESKFGLSALDGRDGLGAGGGTALEGLLSANLGQLVAGICKTAGVSDAQALMIVELTLTAVTMIASGWAMFTKAPVAPQSMARVMQAMKLGAAGFQVVQSGAQVGEAVVAQEVAEDQASITRARAQSERATASFQALIQSICESYESASKQMAAVPEVAAAVAAFLRSDAQTSSRLMA